MHWWKGSGSSHGKLRLLWRICVERRDSSLRCCARTFPYAATAANNHHHYYHYYQSSFATAAVDYYTIKYTSTSASAYYNDFEATTVFDDHPAVKPTANHDVPASSSHNNHNEKLNSDHHTALVSTTSTFNHRKTNINYH